MAEETELFLTKLKELKLLIETSPKYIKSLADDFEAILKRIDWLKSRVEHDGNLNAGGKFEWIDSTLVKVFIYLFFLKVWLHLYLQIPRKI